MPESFDSDGTAKDGSPFFSARKPRLDQPAVICERAWRQPLVLGEDRPVVASRWLDGRDIARQERSEGAADRYVLGVALRPVRARIGPQDNPAFDGMLSVGAVHLTAPRQLAEAQFFSPCDFMHFHVAAAYVHDRRAAASSRIADHQDMAAATQSLHDLVVRDELAAQLSRTLTRTVGCAAPLYAESVGQTILLRLLATGGVARRVGALPRWRMRRVQEHIAAHLADRIRLADLADSAGLSRMHFAAQFKVATGCSPHEYVIQNRIEAAKDLLTDTRLSLVEVALSTGFQTQSHFSGVFKKLVGESPAVWQRAQRHC